MDANQPRMPLQLGTISRTRASLKTCVTHVKQRTARSGAADIFAGIVAIKTDAAMNARRSREAVG